MSGELQAKGLTAEWAFGPLGTTPPTPPRPEPLATAALQDTAAERDRAHATLREIEALTSWCKCDEGIEARRLARERLENP